MWRGQSNCVSVSRGKCLQTRVMATSAPKKPRLDFTREETERFVALYLSHETLWNISSKDYSRTEKRSAALTAISLAFPEKSLTNEQVTSKIANIRTSYSRELRKHLASKTSGSATEDVYQPVWEHFETLDPFLRPHMRQRPSVSNLTTQETINVPDEESQDEVHMDKNRSSDIEIDAHPPSVLPPSALPKPTTKLNSQERFREAVVSSLSSLVHKPPQDSLGKNKQFLHHIGEEMSEITDKRLLRQLKFEMQQLVFNFQRQQEEPNEP